MESHSGYVLTLANSIIGVSILAMPYCFKQCGIFLAIVLLLLSSLISRLSCYFLIKSAIIARRKNFEYLAYYIFGGLGKFVIEIGIIGFLIGTSIAFFIVMGDLGPELVTEVTGQNTSSTLRLTILILLTLFCVLPLGFLRNIDSLAGVTKATIGFYVCLVIKIVIDAAPHLVFSDWISKVDFWRPAGILQCLPIFFTALSCQTQLFEIYHIVQNPSLEKMNQVTNSAINICTVVYLFVGLFGYIAFADQDFTGNILLSFTPSLLTNIIKMGFILSVAFSFPLVIFPCRASFYSLMYKQGIQDGTSDYIPEGKFKTLTLIIVLISLVIGILIPNIEFVLALVGSSIGIMICTLFPVLCFISISQKETNERLLAKFMLIIGVILMVLGTYENLHNLGNAHIVSVRSSTTSPDKLNIVKLLPILNDTKIEVVVKASIGPDIRHEPPQPMEPIDSQPEPQSKEVQVPIGNEIKPPEAEKELQQNVKNDNVDIEAIKKDEKETLLEQKEQINDSHLKEHQILIDKIKKQNEVQEQIVKQQQKLIEVIEKQQEKKEEEEKLKAEINAVKEIKNIALKAIEKISGDINQNEKIVAKLEKDVETKLESNMSLKNDAAEIKREEQVKIEELKLMNNLLQAKIKENNLTHLVNNAETDKKLKENVKSQAVEQPNINDNKIVETNGSNNKEKLYEKSRNDLREKDEKMNNLVEKMLPLPLRNSVQQKPEVGKRVEKNSSTLNKTQSINEDVNALKRDIL